MGNWGKTLGVLAALVLAVGLFPTVRAIVDGSASHPYSPPAVSPAAAAPGEIAKARAAYRAAPSGARRVLLVGNSVAETLGEPFQSLEAELDVAVFDAGLPACGFPPQVRYPPIVLAGQPPHPRTPCDPSWESRVVEAFKPDVVFWIYDEIPRLVGMYRGRSVPPCSATFGSVYRAALEREVSVLSAAGATVAITTSAYSRLFGGAKVGTDDRGDDCENALKRSVAKSTGAQLVDLFEYICPGGQCRVAQDGVTLRPDGFHYQGAGAEIVARWLMGQVGGQ